MSSTPRRALACASILISTALLASGCASVRPMPLAQSAPCSSLVPSGLRADVAPVDLPPADATAGQVWSALDGQTGRLDTANGFKTAALEVITGCEARDAAALRRIARPWWQFWN